MFSAKGRFRGTIYFNADGSFARFVGHPSFRETLSSEWASITTDDRGVDKFTLNPDGMLSVFGTGIHQRVKGEEYAIGLWRLVIDLETGELLGASYHRNLGLEQPATSTLTSLRASGAAPGQLTHSEACSDTAPCVDERASPAWLTRLRIGRHARATRRLLDIHLCIGTSTPARDGEGPGPDSCFARFPTAICFHLAPCSSSNAVS
jgi:hypothetical protein